MASTSGPAHKDHVQQHFEVAQVAVFSEVLHNVCKSVDTNSEARWLRGRSSASVNLDVNYLLVGHKGDSQSGTEISMFLRMKKTY